MSSLEGSKRCFRLQIHIAATRGRHTISTDSETGSNEVVIFTYLLCVEHFVEAVIVYDSY